MADRPTLNDLRVLGTMLPPSERVFAGEAADLVGAIANVVAHGAGLIDAAKTDGVQGVYDFFHNVQVERAKELGVDEPIKGNPVHSETPAPAFVAPQQQPIDYDKLAAAIVKAQQAQQPPPADTHDTPAPETETEGLL